MEKYDLIIVGAGPAGIFTAVELLRHGSKKKMLLVEKGKPVEKRHCPKAEVGHCVNCRPTCAITTGFSGAGAFSDGKLSLSYEVGGDLPTLIGEEFAQELIDYTDKIYLEFGADPHVEGIYTGEDIYRIMQLGADGVQMGPRFVTTEECDADPAFKQTYLDAKPQDIEIIKSPVGMPGRAIHSSFLDRVKEGLKRPKNCPFDCIKTCDVTHSPYCIMLALYNAFKGKLQNGYAFCGANAWRAEKIQSVRDLMAALRDEYDNFSLKEKLFGAR